MTRRLYPISVRGRYGFIDRKGAIVVEPRYDVAGEQSADGLAEVRKDGKVGFIDDRGELVVPFDFDQSFYSYIDRAGTEVFGPIQCNVAGPFRGGLAALWSGDKVAYVDARGKTVWPAQD